MLLWTFDGKIRFIKAVSNVHHMRKTATFPFLKNSVFTGIFKVFLLPFLFVRYAGILVKTKSYLCIPNVDLVLTTKCTLRCKDCSNLMPYYKDSISYSPEELIKDLDALLASVDYIFEVRILGGEPFVYPQLDNIISKCLAERKIEKIRIITNGTLLPTDDCMVLLRKLKPRQKKKILFSISSYAVVADSVKNKLYGRLKNMGYCFYIRDIRVWNDYGLFNKREYSTKDLSINYSTCSLCVTLFNHEISICARAANGTFLGLIPKIETEQVKLNSYGPEQ